MTVAGGDRVLGARFLVSASQYDAQLAIHSHSIALYKRSLEIVKAQFIVGIASELDIARLESLLFSTEAKLAQAQGQRQVTEQAIAILVTMASSSFTVAPIDDLCEPIHTVGNSL